MDRPYSLNDYLTAFRLNDTKWLSKIIVGGLLMLFSFLVLPLMLVLGFLVEAVAQIPSLPAWESLGDKLKRGAGLLLVIIVYSLPLALVYLLLNQAAYETTSVRISFLFLYGLAYAVFYPALIIVTAFDGPLRALDPRRPLKFTVDNLPQVFKVVLLEALSFLIALLGLATVVLFPLAFFYSLVVDARLFGLLAERYSS